MVPCPEWDRNKSTVNLVYKTRDGVPRTPSSFTGQHVGAVSMSVPGNISLLVRTSGLGQTSHGLRSGVQTRRPLVPGQTSSVAHPGTSRGPTRDGCLPVYVTVCRSCVPVSGRPVGTVTDKTTRLRHLSKLAVGTPTPHRLQYGRGPSRLPPSHRDRHRPRPRSMTWCQRTGKTGSYRLRPVSGWTHRTWVQHGTDQYRRGDGSRYRVEEATWDPLGTEKYRRDTPISVGRPGVLSSQVQDSRTTSTIITGDTKPSTVRVKE